MNCVVVRRNGRQVFYSVGDFWSQCATKQILRTDEIFDWNGGRFLRADQFADIAPHLRPVTIQEVIENLVGGTLLVGVIFLAVAGVATLVDGVFGSKMPVRPRRRRRPNYEPLETWKKHLVRQRDREICN